ncbi:MAG: HAMP domain-containing histidine kinase [Campylobacterales bacterium]|nr:HAMP domain-containing histidine kinase [Campylobacterales bacterium]
MLIDLVGYRLLYNNITQSHEKDTQLFFYQIKNTTSDFLSKLLYEYSTQKSILLEKHAEVLEYLKTHPQGGDLSEIHRQINEDGAYNIYITDKELIIRNSTYAPDIGFDLSFAKSTFDEHYEKGIIGCSSPIFERHSKKFLSFSDSYLAQNGDEKSAIVQVSYTYSDTKHQLKQLHKLIDTFANVKDAKAYIIVNTELINDLILKDYPSYKPNINEIVSQTEEGGAIAAKLHGASLVTDYFVDEGTPYKVLYVSTMSAIFDDTKIIYSILFDESEFHESLDRLNYLMLLITVLGIVAIIIISKVRTKEMRLGEQDRFVQSAMHEIKTPLSIITLNNELRELEFGEDEYSGEINTALKTLRSSYDDMSFILTKERLHYPVELLSLDAVLHSRIDYFQSIARANSKTILFENRGGCTVEISHTELLRLIDNTLSNAIKYSAPKSRITVTLDQAMISFHNSGKAIQNSTKIFDKYFRENSVLGGYGLGLSIVSEIAKKYSIEISLESDEKTGTIFTYFLKCHTDDIPSV